MMKRKSFGKLAIVMILAVMMLFGLCVCSKKAESSAPAETTAASQTTTTTTTPATTTKTTTTTTTTTTATTAAASTQKVEEEKKVEAPVEETVVETKVETVVETPVEEKVVEAPVEETVVETAETEEAPLFSTLFSYEGITSGVTAYKDHATVSIPSGVTNEDVKAIADLLVDAYPEAEKVTYSVVDGNLVLEYPETAGDYISAAVSVLVDDAKWLVDTLKDVAVEVTTEEDEEGKDVIVDTYSYHGLAEADVVVGDDYAIVVYPSEYITKADIDTFMAQVCEAYPVLAENVTYEVPEDGTLVLEYSADFMGGTYYKFLALSEADDYVTAYIDSVLADTVVKAAETVVETAKEVAAAVVDALTPVYSLDFSYKGYTSSIVAYSDWAVVEIPEGVTDEDIAYLAGLLVKAYNIDKTQVSYERDGSDLYLYYPEQTDDVVITACGLLENDAKYIIDSLLVKEETAVAVEKAPETTEAPAPAEEKKAEEPAPVVKAEEAPVVAPVTPVVSVTEKGDKVLKFSASLTATPKFNLSKAYDKPFILGFGGRFEADFGSKLSVGLFGQFDLSQYIALGAYGKYTFVKVADDKLGVYGLLGGGAYVGLKGKKSAGLLLVGVGADYSISDNFSVFGELDFTYAIKKPGAELGLTLGAKYTF